MNAVTSARLEKSGGCTKDEKLIIERFLSSSSSSSAVSIRSDVLVITQYFRYLILSQDFVIRRTCTRLGPLSQLPTQALVCFQTAPCAIAIVILWSRMMRRLMLAVCRIELLSSTTAPASVPPLAPLVRALCQPGIHFAE